MAKKRDYRAEYKRRIASAEKRGIPRSVGRGHPAKGFISIQTAKSLGVKQYKFSVEEVQRLVELDAQLRFDSIPKRQKGEAAVEYEFRLETEQVGPSNFNWTSQVEFIAAMEQLGLTEREAYSMWFSP